MAGSNSLELMSTNVSVGINEVVAIFVSRYETQLYDRKDTLSAKIKSLKAEINEVEAALLDSVDKSAYEMTIPKMDLACKVDSICVVFEPPHPAMRDFEVIMRVGVGLYDISSNRSYAVHTKVFELPIEQAVIDQRKDLVDQLTAANMELVDVMGLIKSISRKERQIRGKIAEMKLEEAGKSELLGNSEIVKLISMS